MAQYLLLPVTTDSALNRYGPVVGVNNNDMDGVTAMHGGDRSQEKTGQEGGCHQAWLTSEAAANSVRHSATTRFPFQSRRAR